MRSSAFTLVTLVALFQLSCSKTNNDSPQPTPIPEVDVVTPVLGVYNLNKVTTIGGSPVVTGIGSLTIASNDKTTAAITQIRSFTNTSTGAITDLSSVKNEINKIEKSGNNYVIKSTNGLQWATISANKIMMDDYIKLTPTSSLTLNTEYTK